ncbi:hypothetical protein [Ovoidimarina sediminis]|uniref:hypothetical protein n=1 Tax=Ovoidimarina sediminis TaxID=3079856 RepID=UPI00290FC7F0|nr:hypothetical protein [Rhodophyticola sp. MJ-SS7]MDU8943060.1 hypothetical protein [Rhodophyticola sp. MJ-SS7]
MIDLVFDAVRTGHMLCFAIGIGGAAFLELNVVRRFHHVIEEEGLRLMLFGHKLIKVALIGLWFTGLALLFLRLGVYGGSFSDKLGAKLVVVTLLTLNMLLIDRVVLVEIVRFEGAGVAEIPWLRRGRLGAIAGFSAGCWIAALLLGGIGYAKTMAAGELAAVLAPLLLGSAALGFGAALAAGWIRRPGYGLVPGE